MKKQFITLLLAGLFTGAIASETEFKITTQSSRWKKENSVYTLRQVEKGSDRLVIRFTPEANAWYRLDWGMRYSNAEPAANVGVRVERDGKMGRFQFNSTKEWTDHTLYFSTQDTQPIKIDITLLQRTTGEFQIRDCKLSAIGKEPFALKFLPGGELDGGENPLRYSMTASTAKIVDAKAFLCGSKALELESAGAAKGLFKSTPLPVIPGKKYQLKFWAQSDTVKAMNASVTCWSVWGHKGKHFYKSRNIKIGSECQEYTLDVEIPGDISASPDLRDGVNIAFASIKGEAGKILLSDISFTEVK